MVNLATMGVAEAIGSVGEAAARRAVAPDLGRGAARKVADPELGEEAGNRKAAVVRIV
jgi:hypothetical protein